MKVANVITWRLALLAMWHMAGVAHICPTECKYSKLHAWHKAMQVLHRFNAFTGAITLGESNGPNATISWQHQLGLIKAPQLQSRFQQFPVFHVMDLLLFYLLFSDKACIKLLYTFVDSNTSKSTDLTNTATISRAEADVAPNMWHDGNVHLSF